MNNSLKTAWFGHVREDILSGMTVALALIPEAISFAIICGVDPMVGLYASFCIAVVIAFFGGRPAMISAATGAMALVMVGLVRDYGIEYMFAATILTGVIQFILGKLKVGSLIRFVPHSVVLGFVNSLAILIFMAQLPHFVGEGIMMYVVVGATLVIVYGLPRITKAVPSPLVAIIVMTIITVGFKLEMSTVGDMGTITRSLPVFHLPAVPVSIATLKIILPYSLTLAMVGLLESLLTATIVDEMTDSKSDKNQEVRGQGIANVVAGLFGGMAGCAMIGQSVINVKSGGRSRLSTLVAGVFLLFLILVLGDVVALIPMAALVGVMMMVSFSTFEWHSIRDMKKIPLSCSIEMLATMVIVVGTHNLAYGVAAGIAISAIVFAWKAVDVHHEVHEVHHDGEDLRIYRIKGQIYFAAATHFAEIFDYDIKEQHVIIDFKHAHLWDHTAMVAVNKVKEKYQAKGVTVSLVGLNKESSDKITTLYEDAIH